MLRFSTCAGLVLIAAANLTAADIEATLKGIENRYNHIHTLQVNFTQTYTYQKRTRAAESGTLYLLKPGRMRWEYSSPKGKLWISDGTNIYSYDPQENRVVEGKLKDTDDLRAPLMFLLGKLNFHDDFAMFDSKQQGADMVVEAFPKSDKTLFAEVDFVSAPDFTIKDLTVKGQDGSVMHYTFENEKKDPPVPATMFKFTPPPGAEVVTQ